MKLQLIAAVASGLFSVVPGAFAKHNLRHKALVDAEDYQDLLEYQCVQCYDQLLAEEIDLLAYNKCCGESDGGRGGGGGGHCYDCCEYAGEDQVLLGLGYCDGKACQGVFDYAGGKEVFCRDFEDGGEGGEGGRGGPGGPPPGYGYGGPGGPPRGFGMPGSPGGPPGFNPMGGRGGGGGGPSAACLSIPVQAGCLGNRFCTWSGGKCVPAMAAANDIEGDSEDFDLEEE